MSVILFFEGPYAFLSNFWPSTVKFEGMEFPSVEHAFQSAKTENVVMRRQFIEGTPGQAKRMGRQLLLRSDWEQIKVSVMTELVTQKFEIWQTLGQKLMSTSPALLVEGNNWHDMVWGACICDKCARKPGENKLGEILMDVRHKLLFR